MPSQSIMQLAFPVLLILVFYFLLIRPQKKREKQINTMRNNIKPGDQIVTIGGIYGKVIKIKEDKLVVEISDKTKIEMARWAISAVTVEAKEKKKAELQEEAPVESVEAQVDEIENNEDKK